MLQEAELRRCAPKGLGKARAIGHKIVQFVTRAARANLRAEPDDSHSNIGWNSSLKSFLSQPLKSDESPIFIGASLSPLSLGVHRDTQIVAALPLDNTSEADAAAWLDTELQKLGLSPASSVTLPYELPKLVADTTIFSSEAESAELSALSAWFAFAHSLLSEFVLANAQLSPGPSPVRCWPHHFDIATYVSLEEGDFESAKAVGVGMSPGDETYDQPYFYINPWPHLDAADLPELPQPGHWHKEGFVGAIATAEEILSSSEMSKTLARFVAGAFSIGRNKLGA